MLIPYLLPFIGVSMNMIYKLHYKNICYTYWRYTVTQILANKIAITTFSQVAVKLVPVKYGINLKAAMGIFANRYGIKTINQS